jgi:quercetin dioxygenase-like cupin family protein
MRTETEDGGFRVGIVIDRESHQTDLLLGLEWIDPGTEPVSWKAPDDAHETYYMNKGRLRVAWDGDDAGEEILTEGDSFYFPPARTYTLENVGDDEVFIVWSIIPSP